jgi:hypothetical protein
MAKGNEFIPLLGDPNSPVILDINAFPPYVGFQDLVINKGLTKRLVDKTGIKAVSISAGDAQKPVDLQYLHPSLPSLCREVLANSEQVMPEQANLVLSYPYPERSKRSSVPALGVVLVINSDILRKQINADTKSRFFVRDIRSWTPFLDRYLKQVFLAVGSDNLRTSMQIWGFSQQSLSLAARMAQLRFSMHTGPLLTSA